ncbi:hypothetical protein WEH80_14685 [Actinomycetes bacterium KLBMP 9759]
MPRLINVLRAAAAVALLGAAAACSSMNLVPASQARPLGYTAAVPLSPGGLATQVTPIGTVVTSDGFTVYRFDGDSREPSRSTCAGECARQWPPLIGDGVPELRGVPPELVGTVGRPDGTQQLTLGGWPLYRHAADALPADVTGDGVDGKWHAITTDKP